MTDQPVNFNITPDGIDLLHHILEVSVDMTVPDWDGTTELPQEVQERGLQVAGAILVNILQQAEGLVED